MSRRSLFFVTVASGLGLLLALSSFSICLAQSKKITLHAISAWPKDTLMMENFMGFVDNVNAKAAKMYPGEFEINYKGGPEIVPFMEQVEALRAGVIDIVFTANAYYTSAMPILDVFIATTLQPWEERERGIYDVMEKLHAEKVNAFFLSRLGSGFNFQIFTTKPVKTLADLKGMKLRCSPPLIPLLKKLEVNPVIMGPGDVYTALERNVVDGYIWPEAQISEWGWEAATKFVIEPPLPYTASDIILVNLDVWKKLPKNIQALLIEEAKEAERRTIKRALEYIPRENANLAKKGIDFLKLSDADAKELRETALSVLWKVINQKNPEYGPKFEAMYAK
jgi:TRAP-type C4-dicarboxylate transport system substrate-binding protein